VTPTEAQCLGVLRALRPLQAFDAGLRAVPLSPDRVQGGEREGAPCEHASDRGTLADARRLWSRAAQCSPPTREAIAWLVDYAHVECSLDLLASHVAAAHAPLSLRDAAAVAHLRAVRAAGVAHALSAAAKLSARQVRRAGAVTSAAVTDRHARDEAARHAADLDAAANAAQQVLTTWARERIEAAVAEWLR
jgi:hypothetical protein